MYSEMTNYVDWILSRQINVSSKNVYIFIYFQSDQNPLLCSS